jgi:hypothetical protein
MAPQAHELDEERFDLLNVYCARLGKGWMVHLRPTHVPSYLLQCFDRNLETRAMELDFEDLERYMAEHDATFEKRVSSTQGVELTARGSSAPVLCTWLSTALASGVRVR